MARRIRRAAAVAIAIALAAPAAASAAEGGGLWSVFDDALAKARYIDLTHTLTPGAPVWKGFGPATFTATVDPSTSMPYTYAKDGFEATHYDLPTDQFGTQL